MLLCLVSSENLNRIMFLKLSEAKKQKNLSKLTRLHRNVFTTNCRRQLAAIRYNFLIISMRDLYNQVKRRINSNDREYKVQTFELGFSSVI